MTESRQDRINRFEGYEQWAVISAITFASVSLAGTSLVLSSFLTDGVVSKDGNTAAPEELFAAGLGTLLVSSALSLASYALSTHFKRKSTESLWIQIEK
jgi:hypothetical protein